MRDTQRMDHVEINMPRIFESERTDLSAEDPCQKGVNRRPGPRSIYVVRRGGIYACASRPEC